MRTKERLKYLGVTWYYFPLLSTNFFCWAGMEFFIKFVSVVLLFVSSVLGVEIIDVVEQSVFGQGDGKFGYTTETWNPQLLF